MVIWPDLRTDVGSWAVRPSAINETVLVASSVLGGDEFRSTLSVVNLPTENRVATKRAFIGKAEPVELIVDGVSVDVVSGKKAPTEEFKKKTVGSFAHLEPMLDCLWEALSEQEQLVSREFLRRNADVFSRSPIRLGNVLV